MVCEAECHEPTPGCVTPWLAASSQSMITSVTASVGRESTYTAVGRVTLAPGESKKVELTLWPNSLQAVLEDGTPTRDVGKAAIRVGDQQTTLSAE